MMYAGSKNTLVRATGMTKLLEVSPPPLGKPHRQKSALIGDIVRKKVGVLPIPYLLAVLSNTYGHP